MPYRAKTSASAILDEARGQLERDGADRLSVRAVAASLGLAPNALYRYYADRDALLAAVADEGARLLLAALEDAARGGDGTDAVRAVAGAYLDFARMRPALYGAVVAKHAFAEGFHSAHADLWTFAVDLLRGVTGEATAAEAAVAVWGLLHGIAGLERAGLFDERKPGGGVDFGLQALLDGLAP